MKSRSKSFRQPLIKGKEEREKPQAKTKISSPTLFLRLYGVATATNVRGERERLGQGATTTALQKGTLLHLS